MSGEEKEAKEPRQLRVHTQYLIAVTSVAKPMGWAPGDPIDLGMTRSGKITIENKANPEVIAARKAALEKAAAEKEALYKAKAEKKKAAEAKAKAKAPAAEAESEAEEEVEVQPAE